MDFKVSKKDFIKIMLMLYFIVMTLEESNFSMISGFGKIFSLARVGILCVCILSMIMVDEKNKQSVYIVGIPFLFFSILNLFFSGGGIRFLIIFSIILYASTLQMKEIFNTCFVGLLIGMAFVMLGAASGVILDSINMRVVDKNYSHLLSGTYVRHSFGFQMSNQIPFMLCYLYLFKLMTTKDKERLAWNIIFQVLNIVVFNLCGSRVIFLTIILIGVLQIVIKENWHLPAFFCSIFPVFTLGCLFGTFLFGKNMMNPINILFNFRFSNMYQTMEVYGLHLIGNENSVGTLDSLNGVVVDNGYVMLFLQKGIIIGSLIILFWTWLLYKALKSRDKYLMISLVVLAIINIIDYHFISYLNIPFYCALANREYLSSIWKKMKLICTNKYGACTYE